MHNWPSAIINILFLWSFSFANATENLSTNTGQCNGNVNFSGVFVDLTCTKGTCQGQVPAQDIHVEGNCVGEINYAADGTIPAFYISGLCRSGKISLEFNSQNLDLFGDCIFEDNYYASFYTKINSPFGQASGFCQPNGMSRLYLNGGISPFLGFCRKQ